MKIERKNEEIAEISYVINDKMEFYLNCGTLSKPAMMVHLILVVIKLRNS